MPDYKTMYFNLFNKVTDAVNILQEGQKDGEDMYVEGGEETVLTPLLRTQEEER